MELRSFFDRSAVQLDLTGESKDDVLRELITLLDVDDKTGGILFKMLKRRENFGSTGIGRGIAIPHCRSLAVQPLAHCVRTAQPRHRVPSAWTASRFPISS